MKFTQKWMVVPYDINYSVNNNSSNQILRNRILPSDVKSKLLNELLTKDNLKRIPEKQLPVQPANETKINNIELESLLQRLQKKMKDENEENETEEPMDEDYLEEKNEDNIETENDQKPNDYKNRLAYRKIQKAKRILESTFTQPVSKQSPKKSKIANQKNQLFQFDPDQSGPYQNTRQAVKTKLNTAQIGEGWLSYK